MKIDSLTPRRGLIVAALAVAVWIVPLPAYAYVGPGAAVGLFSAAAGFVMAIISAIGVILLWPIRALMKKIHAAKVADVAIGQDASRRAA
jgi:type VI protein secretion system component VasK